MPWFQMSWPATQFCEAVAWPQLRSRHEQMVSTCTNPNFKRYETLDGCRLWYDVIWSDCKMRLQWYRNLPIPLQRFHVWNTRIPVPTKTSWGMPSGVVRWSCWMAQCLSAAAQYPPGNCTAISFVLDPELWTLKLLVYLYIYIYLHSRLPRLCSLCSEHRGANFTVWSMLCTGHHHLHLYALRICWKMDGRPGIARRLDLRLRHDWRNRSIYCSVGCCCHRPQIGKAFLSWTEISRAICMRTPVVSSHLYYNNN